LRNNILCALYLITFKRISPFRILKGLSFFIRGLCPPNPPRWGGIGTKNGFYLFTFKTL